MTSSTRTNRATPVSERGEATRTEIIRATVALVDEKGYAHVRVSDIVQRAGIGYGTFYLYFHNKLDVVKSVMEEVWSNVREAAFPPTGTDIQWPERIPLGIERTVEAFWRNGPTLKVLWAASGIDPELAEIRERLMQEDTAILAKIIREERKNGYVPMDNPELVSLVINGMCDEVCRRWVLADGAPPRQELTRILTTVCRFLLLS